MTFSLEPRKNKSKNSLMKSLLFVLIFLYSVSHAPAQKIIEQYTPLKDTLRIGHEKDDFLPCNDKGFTLVLPDSSALNHINGLLISFEDKRFDLHSDTTQQIFREATAKNFAVVYISTGIPLDLFFSV